MDAKRGVSILVKTTVLLQSGYHCNSSTPSESYLIPLRLTWETGTLETVEVVFPKAQMEKYDFSPTPLSVFTGNFDLVTKFRVASGAQSGPGLVLGKLRYQACNSNSCLPPKPSRSSCRSSCSEWWRCDSSFRAASDGPAPPSHGRDA